MPKQGLTEIVVLLDRSGSMASVRKDMEGGYDKFMEEQRKAPGECEVTLAQFDSHPPVPEYVYEAKPVRDVPALDLHPRGSTPLLDAFARAIKRTGERLANTPEGRRPERVLFLVITDGFENASTEYKREQVREMVKHQTEKYGWVFSYLGANVDAFAEGASLGIKLDSVANYDQTTQAMSATFSAVSDKAVSYRAGGKFEYDEHERAAMTADPKKRKAPTSKP